MALTKSGAAVDACQEIAQNTILEGTTVDVSGCYEARLHIWFALSNATAHTGTKIIIQTSAAASGDEDWTDYHTFISITGTTNLENCTDNPLHAGDTTLLCADTTGYTVLGSWRFLEDVSTFANSEWIFQTAVTTNTSIGILDGVTRQHAQNSVLNSIAAVYEVLLPNDALRVRIIYDNTYDADGATVAVKASITKVTAI